MSNLESLIKAMDKLYKQFDIPHLSSDVLDAANVAQKTFERFNYPLKSFTSIHNNFQVQYISQFQMPAFAINNPAFTPLFIDNADHLFALAKSISSTLKQLSIEKPLPIIAENEILAVGDSTVDLFDSSKDFISPDLHNELKSQINALEKQLESNKSDRMINIISVIISIITFFISFAYQYHSDIETDRHYEQLERQQYEINQHLENIEQALLSDKHSHNK